MGIANLLCLSSWILLATAGLSCPQEKTEFTSKSPSQWIDVWEKETDYKLHYQARLALGPDGPYAKVAVAVLIDTLVQKRLSRHVTQTLADYGPSIVPSLIRSLQRPEASVRAGCADTLGQVRPKSREAVPALIGALKDPVPEVRAAAARSLARIGQLADKAIPSLVSALGDQDDGARWEAIFALEEMGPRSKPAIPALVLALKDKNDEFRGSAAEALGKIGPEAKVAVPKLIEACQAKENAEFRWKFVEALGKIGPEAKETIPFLVELLPKKDFTLRRWAARALGEIGPAAKTAVPALIAVVKYKSNEEPEAIHALGRIGPNVKLAVPVLLEVLTTHESSSFREEAACALGRMGPAAKSAVPALMVIVQDRWTFSGSKLGMRQVSEEALRKIDPEFAAKNGLDTSYLDIKLGHVPSIKLLPRPSLTEERKNRIKKLIAELAEVENPDFGMSATLTGEAFAPLLEQSHFIMGLITNHRFKTSSAFRTLVEIGPDALPFLLEGLVDKTPTKLKVGTALAIDGGLMWLSTELGYNTLNPMERQVFSEETETKEDEEESTLRRLYTLKVGDICLVAIGQIVGRSYNAVRYQPTFIIIINSPLEKKEIRERVWRLWGSNNPSQKLLDSLLIDYATEGIFNGESLDGWDEGSDYQTQAAMRLLYYFPKETAPLIATRLRSSDVVQKVGFSECIKREVKNGVRTDKFIRAVSWCSAPPIKEALADIAKHTNDPDIKAAVEGKRGPRGPRR